MAVDVRHSPPPLHQPGDVTRRPRGILKNPSFSGASGPGTGEPPQISPVRLASTPSFAPQNSPFTEEEAKQITHQNTLQNAGPRRSSSAARRASASRRASSHGISDDDNDKMRLKWDEANLYLAEQDAGTRQKITEPKTPYQFGDQGAMEEEEDDVAIDPRYVNVDEVDMKNAGRKGRESEIPGLELGEPEEDMSATAHLDEQNDRIVRESSRSSLGRDNSGGKEKHVSVSEGSKGSNSEMGEAIGMPTREEQEKHRQFEERRKRHYEMKSMKGVLGNADYMDEDEPSTGNTTLPERSVNGAVR